MKLTLEQQIVHQLLLRSSMVKDISLFNGKMGLILFFAHYFKHTNNLVYDETADELMDELKEEIHTQLPVGFSFGLSGVGWGIEYLIKNGFVEDNSLEVCKEIDKKIMERDLLRINDYTLDSGFEGLLHYVLAHIKGVLAQNSILPFDDRYLNDLFKAISKIPEETLISDNYKFLSAQYLNFYKNKKSLDYTLNLSSFIEDIEIKEDMLNNAPLGLQKGLSGFLLKKLIVNKL